MNELFIIMFWNWSLNVATNDDWTGFMKNQKNLSWLKKKQKNDSSFWNDEIWMNAEMDSKESSTEWQDLNAKNSGLRVEFEEDL